MANVILAMTMSLDGFVNDRNGKVSALYPDFEALHNTERLQKAIHNTGAVVMGRNAYAMVGDPDWYAGNYEFQVPIFVFTHEVPKKHPEETDKLSFSFVTDGIESAVRQAKAAAGGKDVMVIGGASTAQQCLRAGLADELHVDIMSVLLCGSLRLFENVGTEQIRLERMKVVELPAGRTYLLCRIVK